MRGFPHSSVGKESACNAGDPGSIPGSGRSAGEGIDYPLQYSWVSLVARLVKSLPAMWETWVQSLGWEDSLGEGKGYPLQYSWPGEFHGLQSTGSQRVRCNFHFHSTYTLRHYFSMRTRKKMQQDKIESVTQLGTTS